MNEYASETAQPKRVTAQSQLNEITDKLRMVEQIARVLDYNVNGAHPENPEDKPLTNDSLHGELRIVRDLVDTVESYLSAALDGIGNFRSEKANAARG